MKPGNTASDLKNEIRKDVEGATPLLLNLVLKEKYMDDQRTLVG